MHHPAPSQKSTVHSAGDKVRPRSSKSAKTVSYDPHACLRLLTAVLAGIGAGPDEASHFPIAERSAKSARRAAAGMRSTSFEAAGSTAQVVG